MPLTPSKHISQLADWNDGQGLTGHNDCGPAAVSRYLRASGMPWPGDDHSLVAHVREKMTGQASEFEGQPYVSVAQLTGYFAAAGIPYKVDTSAAGINQPWTLALVRGIRLAPAQYPPSWFGNLDEPDHFILILGERDKDGNPWVNDPLAYDHGQVDCVYTIASLQGAIASGIAYHLADPATIEWDTNRVAHRIPTPVPASGLVMKVAQHLRAVPKVLPAVGPLVAVGTPLVPAPGIAPWGSETTSWRRVQTKDGAIIGWALRTNLGGA